MARSVFAPLEGKEVSITGVTGTFRSCAACGSATAHVSTEPTGMHLGSLVCNGCGGITAWLGRDHLAAMLAAHNADAAKAGAA